jgi:hypothetical protein
LGAIVAVLEGLEHYKVLGRRSISGVLVWDGGYIMSPSGVGAILRVLLKGLIVIRS